MSNQGEAAIDQTVKDSAYWLEGQLENWAMWMRRGGMPRGLPGRASGNLENFTSYDDHSERAYELLDIRLAKTVNAVIDDLAPAQRAAINHAYLHAAFRFPRGNFDTLLDAARVNLMAGLRRKGVWLGE